MASLTSILISWIQLVIPQPCFDEFFVEYNFGNVDCIKVAISKCLGYGIIAGSVMVKVPQVLKILAAASAEGISLASVLLELMAITFTMAYSFSNGYPFTAYGESVFLLIQTWVIAVLVLHYSGRSALGVLGSTLYAALLGFLLSSAAPPDLLWLLQASVLPNLIFARLLQAYNNFQNSSTGQLSAITVFMLFAGAAARIFTSIQETGDMTLILMYTSSFICNTIIALQMIYYWQNKPKVQ